MIQILKILVDFKYKGLKEYVKLILGRIPFIKIKNKKYITVYIPRHKQYIKLRQNTSDYPTFKQIFIEKEYDIEFNFHPKIIIDAGANIGLAAVYFAQKFPNTQIYSIEPVTSNIKVLKKNIKSYRNVKCIQAALHHSANDKLGIIDVGIGEWGFITKKYSNSIKNLVETTKTVSVLSLMEDYEIDIIDILKIDIEGAEKPLFKKKYEKWLPKTRCIIVELHDRWYPGCKESVFKAIKKYNFSCYKKGENLVFINENLKY